VVDPRARTSPEALDARFKAGQAVADLQRAFTQSADAVAAMGKELDGMTAGLKAQGDSSPDAATALKGFRAKVEDLRERFKGGWAGPRFRIFDLAGQLQASTSAPTDGQMRALDQLTTQLTSDVAQLNAVATGDLPAVREKLRTAGVLISPIKPVAPPKRME
jgi:hypothetical protein